jgi:hypothetical protein
VRPRRHLTKQGKERTLPISYHREAWPANIIGDKADYWIERDGRRAGFVRVNRAGRSAGTFTHWTAWVAGTQIAHASTFRALKAAIVKHFA